MKKKIHSSKYQALLHLCRVPWTVGVTHSYSVYYRTELIVFHPPALRIIDKTSHLRVAAEHLSVGILALQ